MHTEEGTIDLLTKDLMVPLQNLYLRVLLHLFSLFDSKFARSIRIDCEAHTLCSLDQVYAGCGS